MNAIRSGIDQIAHSPHQWWLGGLRDPATYPLIVILGFTGIFAARMGYHAALTYKDVRFSPAKRNEMMRSWGTEERPTLVSKWVGWNAYAKEGLGINHDQWLRDKEAIMIHEDWLIGGKKTKPNPDCIFRHDK